MRGTHPSIAVDYFLPAPLSVSENPSGFYPNILYYIPRITWSTTLNNIYTCYIGLKSQKKDGETLFTYPFQIVFLSLFMAKLGAGNVGVSEAAPDHALPRTCEMIIGTGSRFITLEPPHMSRLYTHRVTKFNLYSLRTFYVYYKRPLSALWESMRGVCTGEDILVRGNTSAQMLTFDKSPYGASYQMISSPSANRAGF